MKKYALMVAALLATSTADAGQTCTTVKTPIGERTECGQGTDQKVCTAVQTPTGIRTTCNQGYEHTTCMAVQTPVGIRTTCAVD